MRIVRTSRGARLIEAGTVVSEIIAEPGPTHTFFDVLAAGVAALAPGPRVAILGFAGGGMIAPLRAMGFLHRVEAVDLSLAAAPLFRSLCGSWAGQVALARGDAATWLRSRRGRYDLVLDDLFAAGPHGMAKPEVCSTVLPRRMRVRLGRTGVAVINALPEKGRSFREVLAPLAAAHGPASVVLLEEYENRLVVAGSGMEDARDVSRRMRNVLRAIGSRQASRIRVAALVR